MKTIKIFIAIILSVALGTSAVAQTGTTKKSVIKTEVFHVSGSCGMCKTRIEKAAKVNGVTKAEWNNQSQKLTLSYDASKVKPDMVLKAIAAVGHDTDKYKATDKTYNNLPGCCKYR